jgi:peroxiredoxin
LQQNLVEFDRRRAAVIAVSVDPLATSREMSAELGLAFPIVTDTDRRLIKAVGIYDEANDIAWPAAVIVGPTGHVEWIDVPDSYVLEKRPPARKLLEVVDAQRADPTAAGGEPGAAGTP